MPSFQAICTAVHDVFEAALVSEPITPTTLKRVYDYDELQEGMNTWPAMEVYVESWETSYGSETDRVTFAQDGKRATVTECVIRADLYAHRRSQLDEDWEAALVLANEVQDVLELNASVVNCPPFDLDGIKDFRWTAQRVVFVRAEAQYNGYRFELTMRIF